MKEVLPMLGAESGRIKKIVIFSPNWIGDTIMSLPTARALKKSCPHARITVFAKPYVYALWQACADVDERREYEPPRAYNFFAYIKLILRLRKSRFDLAIILPHYFRYAFIAFLASIPYRVGYAVRHRRVFLTHALPYRKIKQKHMVEEYLDLIRIIGVNPEIESPALDILPADEDWAKAILEDNGMEEGDLIIGLAPGATYGVAKRWPLEKYATLADKLIEAYGAKILIFFGPTEKYLGARLKKLLCNTALMISGDYPLLVTAALIKHCNLFVSNDSGLMHIASAVGTNILAIFGSTDPTWTGPYGDQHVIMRKAVPCSPCFKRTCKFGTYQCLLSVCAEEIIENIAVYLKFFPKCRSVNTVLQTLPAH